MPKDTTMLRFTQSLILLFVCSFSFAGAIQECDNDNGPILFELLSIFASDDDDDSYEPTVYPSDTVRTENFEVRMGANFLVPAGIDGMNPGGIEMALYQAIPTRPSLYIGGSFSYYNYGFNSYDTLFGEYNHINTAHNIYGVNFHMKQRIINHNSFKAYVGLQTGMLFFHTFSKAVDLFLRL